MNVRDELVLLSQLALNDLNLKELEDQKKTLPKKALEADQRAQNLLSQTEKLESQNTELLLRHRKLDGDLQSEKSNLRKWENRANQIRGEREYTSLMSEIGSQKRVISDLETQILQVMESQDTVATELAPMCEATASVKKISEDEWARVRGDLEELDQKIADLRIFRQALEQKLPASTLKRYEQIAAKRGGVGLAFVKKEVCQSCSRMIPAELALRVAKGEVMEQCPSCYRILATADMAGVS